MASHWHLKDAFTLFSPVDALAECCDVSVGAWQSDASGLSALLCQVARPLFACTLRTSDLAAALAAAKGLVEGGQWWVTIRCCFLNAFLLPSSNFQARIPNRAVYPMDRASKPLFPFTDAFIVLRS
jgi:hypothetical protein